MKENEASTILKAEIVHHPECSIFAEALGLAIQALEKVQQYRAIGTPEELQDMKSNYFEALSDWRQYRKIGTLKECRMAVEKQIPKKPIRHAVWEDFKCPTCGSTEIRPYDTEYREYDKDCEFEYCSDCGQKLDWSDEE